MHILFSAKLGSEAQEKLRLKFPEQVFTFCGNMNEAQSHLSSAQILVTYGEDLNEKLLDQAKNLKWIMVISAGMDQMPFEAIQKRDIIVTNARGIHAVPMSEYVISMLLHVYRQERVLLENEAAQKWDRSVRMREITGKTIVIAGTGAIGKEVARLAQAFRMKTIGISRSGKPGENFDATFQTDKLLDVLPEADFFVSILPSLHSTKQLLTDAHFQALPQHAIFVNIGRGDVVASDVLLRAIQNKEIAHAVLDVFENEPLAKDHPFWQEENITITPHLSGISPNYLPRALAIFETNLTHYIEGTGQLINVIDVQRGY
ncbi:MULTISPECIES: D-2-hydroxyacid dehydrogenase [unclassified Virgibacillus]|uniref:D-2-hydroxyacid dehydrogenase n=1 Tax=unclassified Virgibacillus TaxID=2620237 RepID=UPI0024DE545D|nr:D-2-hydroxyacid dehydrogenase [Virgibacillus sp. LDC-1]